MIKNPTILLSFLCMWAGVGAQPLPLLNNQSGISISLDGENGVNWAVEHTFHDPVITDQLIYVKADTLFAFGHNDRNSLMNRTVKLPPVPGVLGADGKLGSGDEGVLHVKIDRDLQSHAYSSVGGTVPDWVMTVPDPFSFGQLTYDGSKPVLGSTGDSGGERGDTPKKTTQRFAYGQVDEFGNEWHTVTYWDDDGPVYQNAKVNPHRQAASDGHWVYVCVNPVTPILQLSAAEGEPFYTTPIKT